MLLQNNDDCAAAATPPLAVVAAEGMMAILAGADTTSTTLSNIMYLLMRYPSVYRRLQDEIDKFYPPGENALDCAHHLEMTYLQAVM